MSLNRHIAMLAILAFVNACSEPSSQADFRETTDVVLSTSSPIADQYIVVLHSDPVSDGRAKNPGNVEFAEMVIRNQAEELVSDHDVRATDIGFVYASSIDGFSVRMSASQAEAMKQDPRVKYVEQDQLITMAPPKKGGSGGGSTAQVVPYGITRVGGFVNYTGTNVAWILDSGVDLTHPDLNVQTANGFTAFTSGKDANLNDGNGHGTHVAGTIAAKNNTIGVVGVAAGAPVVPVKVLDSRGSGSYTGVIAGVNHVAARGKAGDVANMSLGGPVSQALDDAVVAAAAKGIKFVLAAGNESKSATLSSPARANGANIYTISAMNNTDTWASFSNFGNPPVDFCAPGVSIQSTWKGGGYNTISGTSMASPHAAGVLLLGNGSTGGTVKNDPDGNADPIIVR
jgi:subtilisin family serine protease